MNTNQTPHGSEQGKGGRRRGGQGHGSRQGGQPPRERTGQPSPRPVPQPPVLRRLEDMGFERKSSSTFDAGSAHLTYGWTANWDNGELDPGWVTVELTVEQKSRDDAAFAYASVSTPGSPTVYIDPRALVGVNGLGRLAAEFEVITGHRPQRYLDAAGNELSIEVGTLAPEVPGTQRKAAAEPPRHKTLLEHRGFTRRGMARHAYGTGFAYLCYEWRKQFSNADGISIELTIQHSQPGDVAFLGCMIKAPGAPAINVDAIYFAGWPGIVHMVKEYEAGQDGAQLPTMYLDVWGNALPLKDDNKGLLENCVRRAMLRDGWLKRRPETTPDGHTLWHATIVASEWKQEQHFFRLHESAIDAPELPVEAQYWASHSVEVDAGPPARNDGQQNEAAVTTAPETGTGG